MPNPPLSQEEILAKLNDETLRDLIELWRKEQGDAKRRDLDLIAAVLPFASEDELRVLDLCCGPGDVGRSIRSRFANSRIDFVDRDVFLISICIGINRREGVGGQVLVRDLREADWMDGLKSGYDAVAVANALHWLDRRRVADLLGEVFALLRRGGAFVMVEPAAAEEKFAAGFAEWKAAQPPRYIHENWLQFWSRANQVLGYDHTELLGSPESTRIGDKLPVAAWVGLLRDAGFEHIDVILRDADEVMLAALRP